MANLRVDQLIVYPVKSLAGVTLETVNLTASGFESDRRWMIVDANQAFVTQRENPVLSRCRVRIDGDDILITCDGQDCKLPARPTSRDTVGVRIWGDVVSAVAGPPGPAELLSSILGFECSLVYMPDEAVRTVDRKYAPERAHTAFTDGFPILVTSTASLAELNRRLDSPVPMSRFRPNLVVRGGEPFDEDHWGLVEAGDVRIRGVKPCSRCVMTTIDASTAETGKEPLKTLSTFRRWGSHVYFGENFLVEIPGRLSVGNPVVVRSRRSDREVAISRA